MTTRLTACPRNCYSTCTLNVTIEAGRIVGIAGFERNRATPEGPCLKGLAYVERAHSPQRLTRPLRRLRDGSFAPIPWDEALEEIASTLLRLRERHGPQTVLYYSASGTKGLLNAAGLAFWRLFGGCTTTYGDLCWPAGLEATVVVIDPRRAGLLADQGPARLLPAPGPLGAGARVDLDGAPRARHAAHDGPAAQLRVGRARQPEAALASFRKAAELDPTQPRFKEHEVMALRSLGRSRHAAGDFAGARTVLERATTLDPAPAEAWRLSRFVR